MAPVKLFPEKFKRGFYSNNPRDFKKYEGLKTFPRGGVDMLEYWYSSNPEENEYLDEDFQRHLDHRLETLKKQGWDPAKQFAYCISQSHLDLGWMWRFVQGVAKAEATFSKAHRHFQMFSSFTFTGSQPAQYDWIRLQYPSTWKEVVDDVARRRHEPQGGCWCEADGRIPSGEAWVRHRLYGQLFYARHFNCIATVSWFPDSFGFANNLPQIFSKSGATGFYTAKLVSNKETKWPFWAWRWQAPDGSTLTCFMSGIYQKLGMFGAFHKEQPDSDVPESYVDSYKLLLPGEQVTITYDMNEPRKHPAVSNDDLPIIGVFFGEGDGGHGPQGVEVATCRGMVDRGVALWCNTREFFDMIAQWEPRLPTWKDEMYYQFHRGSLTTQTLAKRMNRYFEWRLPVVESLHALATRLDPEVDMPAFSRFYEGEHDQTPTTSNPVEQVWKNVLLMQFHDVISGTSIPEVFDECYEFWSQDKPLVKRLERDALAGLITAGCAGRWGVQEMPLKKGIQVSGQDMKSLVLVPLFLMNAGSATSDSTISIPATELDGFLPLVMCMKGKDGEIAWHPLQFMPEEKNQGYLDARPARFITAARLPQWTSASCWLACIRVTEGLETDSVRVNKIISEATSRLFPAMMKGNSDHRCAPLSPRVHETEDLVMLEGNHVSATISKKDGSLTSLKLHDQEFLSRAAQIEGYTDKPYREPCWNLMREWNNHPKGWFKHATEVTITEKGPVRWTVRALHEFGSGSTACMDYSIHVDGTFVDVTIALDFHEREALLKYNIPHAIKSRESIAETCYATSSRKNEPTANHDVPRWEKWMHSFVTQENDDGTRGFAIINDGKYGFDTLDGSTGISIVHGPEYPGTNIVAWARDERKERVKKDLGEPPTHADQGYHLNRLRLYPYEGSWREGNVHMMAHGFNLPTPVLVHDVTSGFRPRSITGIHDFGASRDMIEKAITESMKRETWIKAEPTTIEVTVLKKSENLPSFLDPALGQVDGIIIRAVNNIDQVVEGAIKVNAMIFAQGSGIFETDLLERVPRPHATPLETSTISRAPHAKFIEFSTSFNPHEIKTFKIVPNKL
ncbi:hypothetical protein GF325_05525 [Candidatus Bathyarchaeota archaeon]|nr:hypothetical protein [Candidatus Bathyarchaeota archaeon]